MWINFALALHPTDEKSEKITELRELLRTKEAKLTHLRREIQIAQE